MSMVPSLVDGGSKSAKMGFVLDKDGLPLFSSSVASFLASSSLAFVPDELEFFPMQPPDGKGIGRLEGVVSLVRVKASWRVVESAMADVESESADDTLTGNVPAPGVAAV